VAKAEYFFALPAGINACSTRRFTRRHKCLFHPSVGYSKSRTAFKLRINAETRKSKLIRVHYCFVFIREIRGQIFSDLRFSA